MNGVIAPATRPHPASDYTSSGVELLSNLPLSAIGGGIGSSCYGWVDPVTQHEYAIMGRSTGTAFVDITDPRNPKYVANLPLANGSVATEWREPKVYGNYVYVGVDRTTAPMQVMDLTKLRSYAGTTMTLSANSNFTNVTKIHTLAINKDTGFLYACGTDKYSGGVMAINVQNPANPVEAGGYSGDLYTHETQAVLYHGPDTRFTGHELLFNSNAKSNPQIDTFSIVDFTNKTSPTRLATKTYTGAQWAHQGWLTEDHKYFFMDDEFDEVNGQTGGKTRTYLWDVSDLTNPILKGHFDQITASPDHNMYVKDGYLYQTNYTSGLHIFKIGDLSSSDSSKWLTEVGSFDTYLPDDSANFNGAWNNYPFFPSGNIIVSDIQGGLFVLRANAVPEPGALAILGALATWSLKRPRRWN